MWKDEDKVTMWKTEEECLPVVKHSQVEELWGL
jgi:hypothetical protein